MSQRIYRVLKFFALVVFAFDMLAPAFVQGATHKKETAARIINATSNTQNQLYCLIAEEFGANEEDGVGHKEFIALFNFDLLSFFDLNHYESATSFAGTQQITELGSQRPLFILHSLLII